jgi:hypothetical protein
MQLVISFGFANSVIHAINEDKNGILWVSTNKGLAKIDLGVFKAPFQTELVIKITNYSINDGLATNQFSNRCHQPESGTKGDILVWKYIRRYLVQPIANHH